MVASGEEVDSGGVGIGEAAIGKEARAEGAVTGEGACAEGAAIGESAGLRCTRGVVATF